MKTVEEITGYLQDQIEDTEAKINFMRENFNGNDNPIGLDGYSIKEDIDAKSQKILEYTWLLHLIDL